jgi:beta-galactosidase GanA
MNKLILLLFAGILFSCSMNNNFVPQKTDLTDNWDTIRPLANPDKGWYHHMLDNGIDKYLIQDEKDLLDYPGIDHLYLRLAWAYLEPEEGVFDWSYIDDIVEKYVPMGYKISFRISCKETGEVPGSMPYKVDGIAYATPYWVKQAGAKGIDNPEFGPAVWTPDWDDPVYLEKLENFHKAFAEKYDGRPWVRYIDVGSIGDWGEGHT